tara:strand:+ start:76564 stop:76857 length:294 start_codon:yes stop_codon:yes gene_type:complete
MFGLGAGELFIILVFALIFIGPKKLPELAKSLGKGIREFQRAKDDLMDQVNYEAIEKEETPESKKEELPESKVDTKITGVNDPDVVSEDKTEESKNS